MTRNEPAAAPTAPDIAYEWIRDHITSMPRDEDAFLNELSLASATQTSRTPVREALLRLESEGFLRRIPRKGAYVPQITDADLRSLTEARAMIERWAATKATAELAANIEPLRALLEAQRSQQHNTARFIELDIEFHSKMVAFAGNPMVSDFYSSLRQRQLRIGVRAVAQEGGRAEQVLKEHTAILDAIEQGADPAAAIQHHLDATLDAAIH